jgi:hypothetical protein
MASFENGPEIAMPISSIIIVVTGNSAKVALLSYFVGIPQVAGFPLNASFIVPCII